MARPSSWLCKTLLLNSRRCISSDSILPGNFKRVLGGSGIVGHQGSGAETVGRATFDVSSSADQNPLIGSEKAYRIRSAIGNSVAASNSQQRAASSANWYGQSLSGVKFEGRTSGEKSSQTICTFLGFKGFNRQCSQSTSPRPRGRPAVMNPAAEGSREAVVRLSNVPKFVFKSDLLWLLKGCNVTREDFLYVYDTKYRLKFIQIRLPSVESFQLVQRILASKGRFGGRYLKLTSDVFVMDDVNQVLGPFRGRSIFMVKVPFGVITEDVERFFSGYTLDSNYPIKFLRSQVPQALSESLPVQVPIGGNQSSIAQGKPGQVKAEYMMSALVRFRTELEALRALREKQGAVCLDKSVDLRFIS